jgi:hypothetical protein
MSALDLERLEEALHRCVIPAIGSPVRIPAKLTDESDDDDRAVSCGAWSLDSNVVGQHGD